MNRTAHHRAAGSRPGVGLTLALVVAFLASATVGAAKGKLWLYPDNDENRSGGHVVEESSFTLLIENRGNGNGDNTVYDTVLLVAVNDPTLLTSVELSGTSVGSDAWSDGLPALPCSGGTVPPHGIYPTGFAVISLGDIADGDVVSVEVNATGSEGLELHYDAIGIGFRETGQGERCYDVVNPSGHDVTQVFGGGSQDLCAGLEVEKFGSTTGVEIGDEVEFLIIVSNGSECELTDLVVIDTIPVVGEEGETESWPAFTVIATDPAPSEQNEEAVTWSTGVGLVAGETTTISVTVAFDEPLAEGSVVVNLACGTVSELEQPVCSEFSVAVGDNPSDGSIGGPGFWCNRIRFAVDGKPSATYTEEEIVTFLAMVDGRSSVFSELWPVSSVEEAELLLCRPDLAETAADRLARHLLTLWLNLASERIDPETSLAELCAGDEALPEAADPEMTIAELVAASEQAILDGADAADLGLLKDIVDFVNNALPAGDEGCETATAPRTPSRSRGSAGRSAPGDTGGGGGRHP